MLSSDVYLLLYFVHVNMGHGFVAVKDASDLLQRRALGLDVDEVDEGQFDQVPEGIEEHEVPVMGEIVPRQDVGLVADGEDGLDRDVHDHHALGAELERQDFERVGDQEPGEADVVEDAEQPDEDQLRVPGTRVAAVRVLVHGPRDGPADKGGNHT